MFAVRKAQLALLVWKAIGNVMLSRVVAWGLDVKGRKDWTSNGPWCETTQRRHLRGWITLADISTFAAGNKKNKKGPYLNASIAFHPFIFNTVLCNLFNSIYSCLINNCVNFKKEQNNEGPYFNTIHLFIYLFLILHHITTSSSTNFHLFIISNVMLCLLPSFILFTAAWQIIV